MSESGRDIFYDSTLRDTSFVGDELATMSGDENYLKQLQLRFLCEEGELIGYPSYGTRIYQYLNKSLGPTNMDALKREAARTILADPRSEKVEDVQVVVNGDELTIAAKIYALGKVFDFTFKTTIGEGGGVVGG